MRIYADKYMIRRLTEEGERLIIKQVVDYFLNDSTYENKDLYVKARILDWIGQPLEAEKTLRNLISNSPYHWKARQELIFLLYRQGRVHDAELEANQMVVMCPWRAESYDTLSYILKILGNEKSSIQIKEKGEEIFKQEMSLFDHIRNKYHS